MTSLKSFMKAGLAVLSLTLGGCMNMYEPPSLNDNPIDVQEEAFLQDVLLADVDDDYIDALAHHYRRHGASPMDLLVTYDPYSNDNTSGVATNKVADVASVLRGRYGIMNVNAGIMPVASQGEFPQLLVSYDSYQARAPAGCDGLMPGLNGRPLENDNNYKLGCTISTLKARQVSRPGDLLGQGNTDGTTDGRSASNIVDYYRSGAQNEPLEGESASD